MREERFELKSWNFPDLKGTIYDNQEDETYCITLYELVDLLNKVSQSEYDLKKIGNEIKDKLDELFEKGGME